MKLIKLFTILLGCMALTQSYHVLGQNHICGAGKLTTGHFDAHDNLLAKKTSSTDLHTVNVVFHVVYNTPEQNLHDSIIMNQFEIIKNDFRRTNADTNNMRSVFQDIVGDPRIKFQMATEDPVGNATNGITRTQTSKLSFDHDSQQAEKVKFTSEEGKDPWDSDKYLNIWICNMTENPNITIYGYSSPNVPVLNWTQADITERDGVVLQYQLVGSNNPNLITNSFGITKDVRGRIATHEIGHYFGLMHIFNDGCNDEGDGIEDTPKAESSLAGVSCDVLNECVDNIGTLGDLPNMYENYMDYSNEACQNSFTLGQINFMRNFLETHRSGLLNTPVGITETTPIWTIAVNPESNTVIINSKDNNMKSILIYDQLGRMVKSIHKQTNQQLINHLNNGIYFIQVSFENGNISTKKIGL